MGKVLKSFDFTKKSALGYDPHKDGVTQTLLRTWLECPRKADLFIRGVTPVRESGALLWGSLAHDLIHHILVEGISDEDLKKYIPFKLKVYQKEHIDLWTTEQVEDFELMTVQLLVVLVEYFKYWKQADKKSQWVALEESFKVPFGYTFLRGKYDGIKGLHKKEWLFETKTKSQIDEDAIAESLPFNFQTNLYLLARKLQVGKVPEGTIYKIIRRPGLRLKEKENLKQYGMRIYEHMEEKGRDYYFKRFEAPVTPDEVQRFQDDLETIVIKFMEWWSTKQPNKGLMNLLTHRPDLIYGMPCEGSRYGVCPFVNHCHYNNHKGYYQRTNVFPELESE